MTPTHSGIGFGWIGGRSFRRSLWTALALCTTALAFGVLLFAPTANTGCTTLAEATRGPDLQVTGLPGVDLRPALGASGLSAASGPYPGVAGSLERNGSEAGTWIEGRPARGAAVDRPHLVSGSWPRRGEIVVELGLARRLGLRTGDRADVATTRGDLSMQVAGIAATSTATRTHGAGGLAYVLPRELRTIAPAPVHGSTLLLQTVDGNAEAVARRLQQQYPAPHATIIRTFEHRCVPS